MVTDPHKAVAALNWVVAEMEERYRRMSRLAVRNIDVFNNRVRQCAEAQSSRAAGDGASRISRPWPYIVVVVDEFADLMIVAGKEIEAAVQRLAQMARAAGIHLIMATQRPSVDIVTGTIKANFPTAHQLQGGLQVRQPHHPQRAGRGAAAGPGRHAVLERRWAGRCACTGPFVSDDEVEAIAAYLRDQGEPRYVDGITDDGGTDGAGRRARAAAAGGGRSLRPRGCHRAARPEGLDQLPAAAPAGAATIAPPT